MQKRFQAQKNDFLGLESEKTENMVPSFENLENMKKMVTTSLCKMDRTLFQTSSRGSEMKQHRFGWKFENTVKMQS